MGLSDVNKDFSHNDQDQVKDLRNEDFKNFTNKDEDKDKDQYLSVNSQRPGPGLYCQRQGLECQGQDKDCRLHLIAR